MAELTVMTWNVQNLLPVGHDDGPTTDDEYQAKLAALAAVIDIVGPDVLALQEVGPDEVLADLNEACAIDFDFRLTGTADGRGIRVALMSPRRLSHRRDMSTSRPACCRCSAATSSSTRRRRRRRAVGSCRPPSPSGGETVTVMTCHLKSKLISYAATPACPRQHVRTPTTKVNGSATPATPSTGAAPRR